MTGGKRRNEDAIFARVYEESNKALFVVCYGMSGLQKESVGCGGV